MQLAGLQCFKVISVTLLSRIDFSMFENLYTKSMPQNHTQNWLWNSCSWISVAKKYCLLIHPIWGNVRGLSQALSKTESNRWIQGNTAGDSLPQGPIDKAVKEFVSNWRLVL